MMITLERLRVEIRGLDEAELERWIGASLVRAEGVTGARLFEDIDWSTERVFRQTLARAGEIGVTTLLPQPHAHLCTAVQYGIDTYSTPSASCRGMYSMNSGVSMACLIRTDPRC